MTYGTVSFGPLSRSVHVGGEAVAVARHDGREGWRLKALEDHPRYEVVENMRFNTLAALGGAVAMASIARAVTAPETEDEQDDE